MLVQATITLRLNYSNNLLISVWFLSLSLLTILYSSQRDSSKSDHVTFPLKLSSGFPTHSEEKSKPFQWLTKICSTSLFPDFHGSWLSELLRPLLSSPFQRAIPWWSYFKLKATRPALTMTHKLDWSSPLSNIQHSHLFTVYLPHLEHKHHDCRIFFVWFTTISPTPTAHSRHSVSNCWMTEYLLPFHLNFLLLWLSPFTHFVHIFLKGGFKRFWSES